MIERHNEPMGNTENIARIVARIFEISVMSAQSRNSAKIPHHSVHKFKLFEKFEILATPVLIPWMKLRISKYTCCCLWSNAFLGENIFSIFLNFLKKKNRENVEFLRKYFYAVHNYLFVQKFDGKFILEIENLFTITG